MSDKLPRLQDLQSLDFNIVQIPIISNCIVYSLMFIGPWLNFGVKDAFGV